MLFLFKVDLAGSENIGRSGAMEKRAREAGKTIIFESFDLFELAVTVFPKLLLFYYRKH